jgi:superfamily II DNA/RNA helicase
VTPTAPPARRRPRRRSGSTTHHHAAPAPSAPIEPRPALPAATGASRPAATSFADLPLPSALVRALAGQGLTTPFPIQAAAIPDAVAGHDLLGRGQTGSGKTLAFGLPLLTRTQGRRAQPRQPLALVLLPTRELAQQVTVALTPYAEVLGLRCTTVVGGLSLQVQATALRRGTEVLIGTPGRIADLVRRGDCRLDRVDIAVVDEADQMADIGFLPQVSALLAQLPVGGQRMLFSATLDGDVDRLVRRFLVDPVTHCVDPPTSAVVTMAHHLLEVDLADRQEVVAEIAGRDGRVMMFTGTKRGADRLARHLIARGIRAAALHGGKSQGQRGRVLDEFRSGELDTLVATNVAARGIHVDDLDLVVNVDPPTVAKDYLHRGGRTARAGQPGTVVTLVLPHQRRDVSRLLAQAGIRPDCSSVGPGHPELVRLTGARPARAAVAEHRPVPVSTAGPRDRRRGGAAVAAHTSPSGLPRRRADHAPRRTAS